MSTEAEDRDTIAEQIGGDMKTGDDGPTTVEQLDDVTTKQATTAVPPDARVVTDAEHAPTPDDLVPANLGVARPDDGTVRTNSAVVPIADALGSGAGAPTGRPANVDRDGREVFPDGVAPTARTDYAGPGAPAEQRGETVPGTVEQTTGVPSSVRDATVEQLVDAFDAEQLNEAAKARGVSTAGSKGDVAERIIEADRA